MHIHEYSLKEEVLKTEELVVKERHVMSVEGIVVDCLIGV